MVCRIGGGNFILVEEHLQGNPVMLEILLFLAGCWCSGIEIFVIPGMAILGLGGGLLIIASLVLVKLRHLSFGQTIKLQGGLRYSMVVLGGGFGSIAAAAAVQSPFGPHPAIVQSHHARPPSGDQSKPFRARESLARFGSSTWSTGNCHHPAGSLGKGPIWRSTGRCDRQGEAIDRGTPVEVTDVSGSRVVVRSVRNAKWSGDPEWQLASPSVVHPRQIHQR